MKNVYNNDAEVFILSKIFGSETKMPCETKMCLLNLPRNLVLCMYVCMYVQVIMHYVIRICTPAAHMKGSNVFINFFYV